jgi:hypothetical protein
VKHVNVMEIAMVVVLKLIADLKPNADRRAVVGLSLVDLGEVGLKEGEGPKGVVLDAVAHVAASFG